MGGLVLCLAYQGVMNVPNREQSSGKREGTTGKRKLAEEEAASDEIQRGAWEGKKV